MGALLFLVFLLLWMGIAPYCVAFVVWFRKYRRKVSFKKFWREFNEI